MKNIRYIQNKNLIINTDVEEYEGAEREFAVVFNIDESTLFYLNETAFEIYKLLEESLAYDEIIRHFIEKYNVTEEEKIAISEAINILNEKEVILVE